jgi:hypothetical protein
VADALTLPSGVDVVGELHAELARLARRGQDGWHHAADYAKAFDRVSVVRPDLAGRLQATWTGYWKTVTRQRIEAHAPLTRAARGDLPRRRPRGHRRRSSARAPDDPSRPSAGRAGGAKSSDSGLNAHETCASAPFRKRGPR